MGLVHLPTWMVYFEIFQSLISYRFSDMYLKTKVSSTVNIISQESIKNHQSGQFIINP